MSQERDIVTVSLLALTRTGAFMEICKALVPSTLALSYLQFQRKLIKGKKKKKKKKKEEEKRRNWIVMTIVLCKELGRRSHFRLFHLVHLDDLNMPAGRILLREKGKTRAMVKIEETNHR